VIAWRSIEYRLTAWYSLISFVTLLTLGIFFWFGITESMRSAVYDMLTQRLAVLVRFTETEFADIPPTPGEFATEVGEYLGAIREGQLVQIRSESGDPVVSSAASAALPWPDAPRGGERRFARVETADGVYQLVVQRLSLAGTVYTVRMASSLESLESTQSYLISWAAWALPVALLLSFSGGFLISRKALQPIATLTQLAAATNAKNLSTRLTVPATGDVIEHLATAFNDMLDRLDASLTRLKQFTADASHELRTPIAVIRTTAELAVRHPRTGEDLRRDMLDIQAEAQRLTALIEDLLLLARADSGVPSFPLTDLDLSTVVGCHCERFRNLAHERGQRLHFHARESATIKGHESSLGRLMTALLENASEHTPSGGCITVLVENSVDGARIRVADTGRGIPGEELDRIFDRFYRVDPSRARSSGGFGLGLSIVRWVADCHGASIGVESELGKGSEFTIVFPPVTGAREKTC
jgi:heavy metal sensor kinase